MQDVDVLILGSGYNQLEIQTMVKEKNPCFTLKSVPKAPWKVLYFCPEGFGQIKIDILVPGLAELPRFSPRLIDYNNERQLPAAPFLVVLLHKVLGWQRHFKSRDYRTYMRHWQDASDVANLVLIAQEREETINDRPNSTFIHTARPWVSEFIAAYPRAEIRDHWRRIGFEQ